MNEIICLHRFAVEMEMIGAWGIAENIRKIIEEIKKDLEE